MLDAYLRHNMRKNIIIMAALMAMTACNPEDRSDEQPFRPEVANAACEVLGDSCRMHGYIVSSQNSDVLGCGFYYGNDTLKVQVKCDSCSTTFSAVTKPLLPGDYYAVSFAENGMGLSTAPDTMVFHIP